jgi:glucose/arabinose dehydrogenase
MSRQMMGRPNGMEKIVMLYAVVNLLLGSAWLPQPDLLTNPTGNIWPAISLVPMVNGLSQPTHITHASDGSGRLFVVEQTGYIRIVKSGVLLTTPFLDIHERVGCCGERGLLSVAFPPGYGAKRHFYVNYTNTSGDTVIARYRVTSDPDVADPNSEEIILQVDQPYANHNGGQLAFGPNDGYLYIGMGDGGSAGDPQNRAQNPALLLGKILRIDVGEAGPITSTFPSTTYTIPPTNPYTQTAGYRGEIWALGLRNPWRFSFDRLTGDLYIGDVGQNAWEEIDFQPASSAGGENYGWRILEGSQCYHPPSGCVPPPRYSPPVAEYNHTGNGCSVTGGFVYRGTRYLAMRGIYFYGDYCSGRIWGLRYDGTTWKSQLLQDTSLMITTFGEDEAGNLYVADYNQGIIYRIEGKNLYLPHICK